MCISDNLDFVSSLLDSCVAPGRSEFSATVFLTDREECLASCRQGTSRFLDQGGAEGGGRFFTNNMIFLECGVIALFEAFYMFRDHNHLKMKF